MKWDHHYYFPARDILPRIRDSAPAQIKTIRLEIRLADPIKLCFEKRGLDQEDKCLQIPSVFVRFRPKSGHFNFDYVTNHYTSIVMNRYLKQLWLIKKGWLIEYCGVILLIQNSEANSAVFRKTFFSHLWWYVTRGVAENIPFLVGLLIFAQDFPLVISWD